MKPRFVKMYMEIAGIIAKQSYAKRLQVGAIVVKDDRIISIGYNGMPAGWDNNCEDREYMSIDAGGWLDPEEIYERWPYAENTNILDIETGDTIKIERRYQLITKPEVLHAESNAIAKLAKSNDSGDGADIFITHAPCIDCAKLIYQSGIRHVYYSSEYRNDSGIEFLKKSKITVEKINLKEKGDN